MNHTKLLLKVRPPLLVQPRIVEQVKPKTSYQLRHEYKKRRREQLWRENPHCYWCGRITRLGDTSKAKHGDKYDDVATLDHLVSRLEIPFGTVRPNLYKKAKTMVLACWKCNNERNKKVAKHLAETSPERLWQAARNNRPNKFKQFYRKYIRRNFRYYWWKITHLL